MAFVLRNFDKTLQELDLDDLIYKHVGRRSESPTDVWLLSTLDAIEENMRHSRTFEKSKIFNPSLCAFAILEQLGTTYADASVIAGTKTNGIRAALHNFCGIPDQSPESHHLYRFRNAIMHDASMTNVWTERGAVKGYYFFRYSDDLPVVMRPSSREWNGTFADISDDTTSLINQTKLVDLVSDAISAVSAIFFDRRGDLKVLVDKDTILTKFLVWKPRQPKR